MMSKVTINTIFCATSETSHVPRKSGSGHTIIIAYLWCETRTRIIDDFARLLPSVFMGVARNTTLSNTNRLHNDLYTFTNQRGM